MTVLSERDWEIRLFVYQYFVAHGLPPDHTDIAAEFHLSLAEAQETLHRLHQAHTLYLKPGTGSILIANPLSAIPTPFQVTVARQRLFANCAWDSLGIPAMLHQNAKIEAREASTGEIIRYEVKNGELIAQQDLLVHFALPFQQWYDNLEHT